MWPPPDPVLWTTPPLLSPDCLVEINGFRSIQHAYQAAKTDAPEWVERVRSTELPSAAWAVGQRVPLRADWNSLRLRVMSNLVLDRVRKDHDAVHTLLSTGDATLVHGYESGSPDPFWGVDLHTGEGWNRYGDVLMTIRGVLRRMQS